MKIETLGHFAKNIYIQNLGMKIETLYIQLYDMHNRIS